MNELCRCKEFESPDCANRLLHGWQCLLLVVRWLSLILRWQHDNICCVVSLLNSGCNEDGRRSSVCGQQTLLWLLDDVQMTSWRTAPLTDCSTCLTDCYIPTLHGWSLFVWTAWKSGSLGPPPVDTASACPSSCPLPLTRPDVMEDNAQSSQLYTCLIDWGSRLAAFPSTCVRLRPTSCWLLIDEMMWLWWVVSWWCKDERACLQIVQLVLWMWLACLSQPHIRLPSASLSDDVFE